MSSKYRIIKAFEDKNDRESSLWAYNSGYREDPEFKHHDYGLYKKDGKATLVYRSTDVKNIHDLEADLYIAAGRESQSNRFKIAEDAYARAVKKYGKDNVDVTGFSLGGSQAMYISNKYKAKATVFNPGYSPVDLQHHLQHPRDYSKVDAYITAGDAISNTALAIPGLKKKVIYDKETYKGMAKTFGTGAVSSATKVPLTNVDVGIDVLKRGAEIAQPELIPIIEGGAAVVKGVGTGAYVAKNLYNMHSLKSMEKQFGSTQVESVTPSFQSARFSSELASQVKEMEKPKPVYAIM